MPFPWQIRDPERPEISRQFASGIPLELAYVLHARSHPTWVFSSSACSDEVVRTSESERLLTWQSPVKLEEDRMAKMFGTS